MDVANIITVICTLGIPGLIALGGAVWTGYQKIKGIKDEMRSEFEKTNKEISDEKDRCEKDRSELNVRFLAIEARVNGDVPTWVMSQDGMLVSASSEFVRIFCAPRGYRAANVINKKLDELTEFSKELVDGLAAMEREVLIRKYAHRSGVDVGYSVKATIIMTTQSSSTGDPVFIAYAVPE